MSENDDYLKYRGRCRELAEAAVKVDPTLTLIRGYYHCPFWGEQQHWWCKAPDGKIVDPSKDQFPSKGAGVYVEFDGSYECEYCGKPVKEDDAYFNGHHAYCSYDCAYHDVMG